MRFKIKSSLFLVLLSLAGFLAGCKGKEGDPGPAGTDGGEGAGFAEAIKYGNVLLYLDGSYGEIPFKDTVDFKFSNGDLNYSSVYEYEQDVDFQFRITRWSGFDNYDEDDYFEPRMRMQVFEGDTTLDFNSNIRLNVPLSNHSFFRLYTGWYNDDGSNFTNEHFDGFKYDKSTGTLYCRFSFIVPAENNTTGNDLNVSGVINVKVYVDESD